MKKEILNNFIKTIKDFKNKMKSDFYFIHGWGFDKTFWQPVCKKFKKMDFLELLKYLI